MLDEERLRSESLENVNEEMSTKLSTQKFQLDEISAKNEEINKLIQKVNDLECSLGEHKQWLEDANNRASYLDNLNREKDQSIEEMAKKVEDKEHGLAEVTTSQEIMELKSVIENLRREVEEKNDYICQIEKVKGEVEWSLGEHRQWLEDANNRIGTLENEKLDAWKKVSELEERIAATQSETSMSSDAFNEMKSTLEQLELKLAEKVDECERFSRQKTELEVSSERLRISLEEAEKSELLAERKKLEEQIEERDNQLVDINKYKNELEIKLNKQEELLQEANNKIKKLEEEAYTRKDSVQDSMQKLDDQFKELKEVNEELHKTLLEKQEALSTLPEDDQMMKEICQQEARSDEVSELLSQTNEELTSATRENEELKQVIEDLRRSLSGKETELSDLHKLRNDTEWSLGEHKHWLNDAKIRIEELENSVKHLNEEVISCNQQCERLKAENNDLKEKTEQTVSEEEESKIDDQINLLSTIDALKSQLDQKEAELSQLYQNKNEAEWYLGEHRCWLANANQKIEELQKLLEEKDRTIKSLETDVQNYITQAACEAEKYQKLTEQASLVETKLIEVSDSLDHTVDYRALIVVVAELKEKLEAKNIESSKVMEEKEEIRLKLQDQERLLKDVQTRINNLEKIIEEKDDSIIHAYQEINDLKTELEMERLKHQEFIQQSDHIKNLEQQLQEKTEMQQLFNTENELKIRNLENELSDRIAQIDQLKQQIDNQNITIKIEVLDITLIAKDQEISGLRRRVQSITASDSEIDEEDEELLEALDCLEKKLGEAQEGKCELNFIECINVVSDLKARLRTKLIKCETMRKGCEETECLAREERLRLKEKNAQVEQLAKLLSIKEESELTVREQVKENFFLSALQLRSQLEKAQCRLNDALNFMTQIGDKMCDESEEAKSLFDAIQKIRDEVEWQIADEHKQRIEERNQK
ncbi:unnamed protein product [Thelazia callipaeda]|uniref:GRIP domain-containing protein n=1 Tax=Thelazia callipaeda TaxID=103827 RepID=A0A0N5CYB6_THECL|nr:unnamed protein product [Thelazia callipaeda]